MPIKLQLRSASADAFEQRFSIQQRTETDYPFALDKYIVICKNLYRILLMLKSVCVVAGSGTSAVLVS